MSIIDSFCPQINLFCETFNSSEYFQVVRENTNISSDLVRTRQKQLENFLTSTENATLVTPGWHKVGRQFSLNTIYDHELM